MSGGEVPVNIMAAARAMNATWLDGNKATLWVCGLRSSGYDKPTTCSECGGKCYFSEGQEDMMVSSVRKICIKCACTLDKYRKSIKPEQLEVLETVLRGQEDCNNV